MRVSKRVCAYVYVCVCARAHGRKKGERERGAEREGEGALLPFTPAAYTAVKIFRKPPNICVCNESWQIQSTKPTVARACLLPISPTPIPIRSMTENWQWRGGSGRVGWHQR